MSRDFSTVVDDYNAEPKTTRGPALHFDIKRFITLRLASVLLIGTILAIPLGLLGWFLTPVEFTATAQIQFRSVSGSILEDNTNATEYGKFVSTEINKLTGDKVLQDVLNRPDIITLPSIRQEPDKLTFLKGRLSARLLPGSELVNVTCTMSQRQEALQVLKAVVDVYERQATEAEDLEDRRRIEILRQEIDLSETKLTSSRTRLEELEGGLGGKAGGILPQDSKEAEQYRESMLMAQDRLKEAENLVARVEQTLAQVEALQETHAARPGARIYEFDVEMMVNQDPRVAALKQELALQENSVALLRETMQEAHPKLRAALKSIETMRGNIERQEQMARTDALRTVHGRMVQDLEIAKQSVRDQELARAESTERYNNFLTREQDDYSKASEDRAKLEQFREEISIDRNQLTDMKVQYRNMLLNEEATSRVQIQTDPYAPLSQGITKKLIMTFFGICAAFGVGIVYGVLRELLDQQIRTPQDIGRISSHPIVAAIPHMSEDKLMSDIDNALLMAQQPNSIVADEYRRILARILFPEDNAAEISSLLVVSASPGEGKTSVATNLAVALEHANRKVLLIDLSSQRPCVERTFGLDHGPGLSDLLSGACSREEVLRRTAFENLGVLGPGTNARELAGRLASREMMDFLEWADEHFDHIIVDTPPLLLMSDAKLLAPAIDGVLFVVGAGYSTLGIVSRCLREMDLLRANVIGVVLNGVRSMRGGYLKANRNLFYAYTESTSHEGFADSMPEIKIVDDDDPETPEGEVVLLPFDQSEK